jgi:type VI protein secretion system component Hcp
MYFGNLPICWGTARIIEFQWEGLFSFSAPRGSQRVVGTRHMGENMNTKILIAALAGLSLVAAAQSQTDKQEAKPSTTQTQSPRDTASGQATGRLEQKNLVHRDLAARDVASGHATGKKSAQDDWEQTAAKPASGSDTKPSHVAVGDVNGDGHADVAVSSKNSAHATEAAASTTAGSAKVQGPRDVASGQATGKRQHQPITITKEVDKASTRVATGDVNGDGAPDVAASRNSAHATESATSTASASSNVQGSRDAASGQMTGKRQHQPMTVRKEVDKATPLLKQ